MSFKSHEMVLYRLQYLAAFDHTDIDADDFEIIGEDEHGNEGVCTDSITTLAADAIAVIEQIKARADRLEALAEERRQFIINGEDLGYIRTPDSENDKAYHVFMRCRCEDETAAKRALWAHDANKLSGLISNYMADTSDDKCPIADGYNLAISHINRAIDHLEAKSKGVS